MLRKCLIAVLLLILAGRTKAQEINMGIRQGLGIWFVDRGIGMGSLRYASGDHFSWNKELFFRQRLKSKWAYEISFATYQVDNSITIQREYESIHTEIKGTYVEHGISLQYDMTYPLAGYVFPWLRNMKSYVGFAFIPRIDFKDITHTTVNTDMLTTQSHKKETNLSFWTGFNYTHMVPLTPRLTLTSTLQFKMKPFDQYFNTKETDAAPNRQVSVMTGLCYRL